MKKKILFVLFGFIFTAQAKAQVYVSPAVQSWLGSTATFSESEIKLLVLLQPTKKNQYSVLTLKKSTLLQVAHLQQEFSFLAHRKMDLLWAANGFFVSLKNHEIVRLLKSSQVKAISDADQKITVKRMNSENSGFNIRRALMVDYTYGLKNIKVPDLKKAQPNLTGAGIKVGILDTGLYAEHPDLKGRLNRFKNFSPSTDEAVRDPFGHGTHVAGTIAGAAQSGTAIGVAPEADLVIGRIFDGSGESTKELILKAMQWMLDPDENPQTTDDVPRVVNNSWGDDEPYTDRDPQDDPFCRVIDTWLQAGIVPVFSAGNSGPKPKSINVPGACPGSLTVGATEQWDRSPHFSGEGPAQWKTVEILKPNVVAPGVNIRSAGNYGNEYEVMSGTSMSAPHVSGALALLFQARPELKNTEAIALIETGVKDLGNPGQDTTFGFGRIDIAKSVSLLP